MLVRAPVRITLRVWEYGLSTAAEAARIGRDLLEPDRDVPEPAREVPEPDFARHTAPPRPDPEVSEPATFDAPPAVPDELIPDHVDEEPVLVAEAAEAGAEDGAGPELTIVPPWDGYEEMTAADIRDRLSAATTAEAGAVELYERTHKNRSSVIDASERAQRR